MQEHNALSDGDVLVDFRQGLEAARIAAAIDVQLLYVLQRKLLTAKPDVAWLLA